ncbi:MAG: hypothetical protein ACO241_12105 [Burkholderiaceae bacterium]
MATNFLTKIFGSRNDRLLKQYRKTVERINALEPAVEKLSDEALAIKDRMAARIIRIMPHDQALIISGARGDSEAMAVILSNEATQENLQYSVSASKSLTPKILKIYSEGIGELIEEAGR